MNVYHIRVDGRPYQGEDPERTYESGEVWTSSWHPTRFQAGVLIFGEPTEKPKVVMGNRNLRGEIDKILRRIDDGMIAMNEITITRITGHD